MTGRDFKKKPYLLNAPKQSPETYKKAIETIQSRNLDSYDGIKHDSIFNDLSYFHVCEPGMPPCIAHDLFEGVVPYDVALIVKYFVKTKNYLSYKILNRKIAKFPFKNEEARNKPGGFLINKAKLVGHAIQNWTLI